VAQISPDATEANQQEKNGDPLAGTPKPAGYRTLVTLKTPYLESNGQRHRLSPGMQVAAEIHLGTRTVMEYLLSPVQKAWHEAGRER
jgi:HlyD family secretion protein